MNVLSLGDSLIIYLIRISLLSFSIVSFMFLLIHGVCIQNFDPKPRRVDMFFGGCGVPGEQRLWKLDVVGLLK